MNPMQLLIQRIRGVNNPQQMVINLLEQQVQQQPNNPIVMNLLQCAKKGDTKGIQQIASNICQEQNADFSQKFNEFRN